MTAKDINIANLPDTIRQDIKTIENASQVEQLTLFVDNKISGEGLKNSFSNTFVGYDLWSRFIRNQRKHVRIKDADDRVVVSRKISERIEKKLYEGVIDINPALIRGEDSDYFAWPGDREEKVERALVRLASQGKIAKLSGKMGERYAVYFSIREIQNELKSVNQTLSATEIKEALNILKGSELSLKYRIEDENTGEDTYSESKMNYLSSIHFSGSSGKANVKCIAVLNEFMSQQIETIGYRGYYFDRVQSFKRTLSRWLSLRLYQMFKYAAPGKEHHFSLKKISIKFGSIESEDIPDNRLKAIRRDMTNTMQDLKKEDIIKDYIIANVKNDLGVICDYVYKVFPTDQFCEEVLTLNKKHKGLLAKAEVLDGDNLLEE